MKKTVAFVCTHNSCRSQMAEAWAKHMSHPGLEVYSAGTQTYPEIKHLAVEAMKEAGVDMSGQYPKMLDALPGTLDILITMGCGVECPHVQAGYREDWGLEDPSGHPIESFRETRDLIKANVQDLLLRIKNKQV